VQPKSYVAGSRSDVVDSSGTFIAAAAGAAIAAVLLVVGVTANVNNVPHGKSFPGMLPFVCLLSCSMLSCFAIMLQGCQAACSLAITAVQHARSLHLDELHRTHAPVVAVSLWHIATFVLLAHACHIDLHGAWPDFR
jgi:hypothetical protein